MSAPGSPISESHPLSTDSPTPSISMDAVAAAAERRVRNAVPQKTAAQLAAEHDRKQKFRRMLDPGITWPNAHDQAVRSLNILLTIAENVIREPDNEKYQRFKPTNSVIKRDIMDPKGTVEYAREMGFHPHVIDFQPYYIFNPRFKEEVQIGASILRDYLELVNEKQARAESSKKNEKAAKEAAAEKVKLAFMDDRKTKSLRDDLEREQRAGRIAAAARRAEIEASTSRSPEEPPEQPIPGSGRVLGLLEDEPPAYHLKTE